MNYSFVRYVVGLLILLSFASASVLAASPATASPGVDGDGEFVGYFRAGAGVSSQGGPQNCYYLGNGAGHGYRFGNECDSYAELGYGKTLVKTDNGTRFVGRFMVNDYSGDSAYTGNVQIV